MTLTELGTGYGYFANATKTVLLTKPQHLDGASHLFGDIGIAIKCDGCRYLSGAVGEREREFCFSFMKYLAEKRSEDLCILAKLAQTQPHVAYTVFTKITNDGGPNGGSSLN